MPVFLCICLYLIRKLIKSCETGSDIAIHWEQLHRFCYSLYAGLHVCVYMRMSLILRWRLNCKSLKLHNNNTIKLHRCWIRQKKNWFRFYFIFAPLTKGAGFNLLLFAIFDAVAELETRMKQVNWSICMNLEMRTAQQHTS